MVGRGRSVLGRGVGSRGRNVGSRGIGSGGVGRLHIRRIDGLTSVDHIGDVAAVSVVHLIVDRLETTVGQGHRVGTGGGVTVPLLAGVDLHAVVVIGHGVVVGVHGWLVVGRSWGVGGSRGVASGSRGVGWSRGVGGSRGVAGGSRGVAVAGRIISIGHSGDGGEDKEDLHVDVLVVDERLMLVRREALLFILFLSGLGRMQEYVNVNIT
jgi:hypothetical protein